MKIRTIKRKKGFTLIELLVVIAIMVTLAGVGYPVITSMIVAGDRQAASENLKQIGTALQTFKTDIKSYPSDATAKHPRLARTAEKHGEVTGTTSNPYFRQLFYKAKGGVTEENFYAALPNMVKGDNNTGVGETLKPGECAFSYVMLKPADTATATTGKAKGGKNKKAAAPVEESAYRPVTGGPIAFCGTTINAEPIPMADATFDLATFKGYAYAVTTDGSIVTMEEEAMLEPIEGDDAIGRFISGMEPFPKRDGVSTIDNAVLFSPEPMQ